MQQSEPKIITPAATDSRIDLSKDTDSATIPQEGNNLLTTPEDVAELDDAEMQQIMQILRKSYAENDRTRRRRQCLTCSICEKTFGKICNAVDHVRTHLAQKPFSCSNCGKTYTQQGNRDRHMKNGVCARR